MDFHSQAQCQKCAFFFAIFKPSDIDPEKTTLVGGQCRKATPTSTVILVPKEKQSVEDAAVVVVPVIERVTLVPHVAPDFWCGEYKQRVVAK